MDKEIGEFVKAIGAIDIREHVNQTELRGLFKRPNYFFLPKQNTFLIVKVSRSKLKDFWGVRKKFIEFFKAFAKVESRFHVVCLNSGSEGWALPGAYVNSCIEDGALSYSVKGDQYKINGYNLKDQFRFRTTLDCMRIIAKTVDCQIKWTDFT